MDRNPFQALIVTASLQYKAGIPAVALDLAQDGGKRALAYGELDERTLAALAREHVTVTTSSTAADAMRTLAWSTFDAVIVAAPNLAYLERTDRYPLARSVARFDASRLFAPGGGGDGAGVA